MARPTLEEEAVRNHQKASTRLQNSMAKNVGKAGDIITWLLEDIHKSVNPRNIGKKDQQGNEVYQPQKYKENTQISVAKEFISNNKEFIKAQEDLAKAEKALSNSQGSSEEEDFSIELDLTSEQTSANKLN